ncbi:MAG: rhodanese-like domain-containing protein [Actinomycetota bacterium]
MTDLPRALIVGQVATDEPQDDVETVSAGAFPRAQLRARFGSILLGSDATTDDPGRSRLLAHNCAVHLVPGGSLAVSVTPSGFAADLAACGFDRVGGTGDRTFWRRTERRTVHDITAAARLRLERLSPEALAPSLNDADVVVVDLRIPEDRRRHGVIPGSVPIPRSVLEWRADPTSGYPHDRLGDLDARVVLACNEGYSSSIAAANLLDLGYRRATDLIGGVLGWTLAGLPTVDAEGDDDELFLGPVEDRH